MEEAINNGIVSLGGITVGLAIIVWHVARWWNQNPTKGIAEKFTKKWRPLLIPYLPFWGYGALLILSAGGLLGSAANIALWGSNEVGRIALQTAVGGEDVAVTRSAGLVLDPAGHAVVILLTVVVVALFRFNERMPRAAAALSILSGVCLGLSGGVAGFMAEWLGAGVDTLGGAVMGLL